MLRDGRGVGCGWGRHGRRRVLWLVVRSCCGCHGGLVCCAGCHIDQGWGGGMLSAQPWPLWSFPVIPRTRATWGWELWYVAGLED